MRDPERIERILERLGDLWKENPDLRLTQLVYFIAGSSRHLPPLPELFYLEDDLFEQALEQLPARLAQRESAAPTTRRS